MTRYLENWNKPGIRLVYHSIFWIIILAIYYFNYRRLIGSNGHIWLFVLKDTLVTAVALYSLSSKLVTRFFSDNKGLVYALLWFVLLYFFWGLATYYACLVYKESFNDYGQRFGKYLEVATSEGPLTIISNIYIFGLDFIYVFFIPVGPKLVKLIMEQIIVRTKVERDNLELELEFLKSQVNPHFLFNTLNNIYTLLDIDYEKGREMVLRLTALMRYTLYESKTDYISLTKELNFIRDFITLMRIRYGERIRIESDLPEIKAPYKIIPLILLPFVENAFKHGPDKHPNNDFVSIKIEMEGNVLILTVKNKLEQKPETNEVTDPSLKVGGFGLKNIFRRLELYYKNKHQLDTRTENGEYVVQLKVNLKFS